MKLGIIKVVVPMPVHAWVVDESTHYWNWSREWRTDVPRWHGCLWQVIKMMTYRQNGDGDVDE